MAPVDPHVLLNTIAHLLDASGGLKNDRAVRQIIILMKLTEKLVNKAIYLQILAETRSENTLKTFLKNDGLQILLKWLSHFTLEHNHVFLLDTLNILGQLPFDSDIVQQIDINELQLKIAELASAESGEKDIRESARRLYDVWSAKQLFTTITTSIPIQSSLLDVDERTFSHSSSSSRTRTLITVDTSICKHPLTSQTLNLDERYSSDNDSHVAAARKMATTATLTAGASSSSSHSSTDNYKRISEENIVPANKKKSIHRHLTVQQQSSNMNVSSSSSMRPLGVSKMKRTSPPKTEEISESIDGLASAMSNSVTAKNLGGISNRSPSTFRIPKLGRSNLGVPSSPNETVTSPNHGLSPSQTTMETTSESIPKESLNIVKSGGMPLNRQTSDELNSQQIKRKFSLSQYNERKRLKSNELQLHNAMADTDMRIMLPTNSNNNTNLKDSPPTPMDDDLPAIVLEQPIVSPKIDESSKDTIIKSNLSEPGVKKVVKKKVIWADEKNQSLVQTSFFEMDDSEVADMHAFARTCASNISIAQLEKVMERDLRKRRGLTDTNSFDGEEKQFLPPLPTLRRILIPDSIQIPTIQSNERFVQEEREKTVLQALFIRSFLPDSPGEPDGDVLGGNVDRTEPKLIPLDDDNSLLESNKASAMSSTVSNTINIPVISTSITTPAVSTNTPSLSSFSFGDIISPEVAQILAQAKGNQLSATANHLSSSTNPSTITTTTATTSLSINPPIVSTTPVTTTLPAPPNFLPALLNAARNSDGSGVPSAQLIASLLPNLAPNFNLPPPPTSLNPLNQLLASAFPLSFPSSLTGNVSLYQPTTFSMPPPSIPSPMLNAGPPPTNSNPTSKPQPSVRFVSAISQPPRSMQNSMNGNELQQQQQQQQQGQSSARENSRDNNYRRGPSNSRNDNNRRDYHPNRNNNRNIFS